MRERDGKGRFTKKGSEKAEKKHYLGFGEIWTKPFFHLSILWYF